MTILLTIVMFLLALSSKGAFSLILLGVMSYVTAKYVETWLPGFEEQIKGGKKVLPESGPFV